MKSKWFTYYEEIPGVSAGWKIKVKDLALSPVALLPVANDRSKKYQGARARMIVRLVNKHFQEANKVAKAKRKAK